MIHSIAMLKKRDHHNISLRGNRHRISNLNPCNNLHPLSLRKQLKKIWKVWSERWVNITFKWGETTVRDGWILLKASKLRNKNLKVWLRVLRQKKINECSNKEAASNAYSYRKLRLLMRLHMLSRVCGANPRALRANHMGETLIMGS